MFVRGSIYMDYQATTPLAERAFDAMEPFYKEIFGNPHSADHAMGWEANSAVESARQSVSTLIGANVDEVIFTSGATESNNLVFHSVCQTRGRRTKILISSIEHKSVLDSATAMAEMYGLEVVCIPVDRAGLIDIRLFGLLLADDVLIVSVMAVNNEIGTVQDIPLLCKMSHGAGAIFHTDASQAPSAMEVDVSGWGVDLLSLSSHKIYGPKGIGALYVNSALKEELRPLHYGGGQEDGKRAGTISPALCVGFGVAAGLVIELGLEERSMVRGLRELFIDLLLARNLCFSVNGMSENGHPGNISITFSGVDASLLLSTIGAKVCASLGSACSSGFHATSHVLQAVGLNNTQAESTVRFSIGRFTDVAQIESAVDAIDSAVSGILRGEV